MITSFVQQLKHWLAEQFILQKLNNPLGYLLMIVLTLMLSYVFASIGFQFSVVFFGAMVGAVMMMACFVNLQFGLALALTATIFVLLGAKYVNAPLGVIHDGLLIIMFIRMLAGKLTEDKAILARSPVTVMILIWVGYCFIQVLNPWAASKLAWLLSVRAIAVMMLFYFVACYAFDSYKKTVWGVKAVIALAVVYALYALKQEFFGFSQRELIWLYSNEDVFQRIFQWSRLRVFSFCVDPTTFGIFMSYVAVISLILVLGPYSTFRRATLLIGAGLMIAAMAYAGSRTPFVMIPLGLIFFTLMTMERKVVFASLGVFLVGAAFMMKSTGNAVIYRIQSAFNLEASGDTMNVRLQNQAFIQPFIHEHPFGAGIGSSGEWGARFNPDSMLAGFAHDSAFVRVAVELGWIGLIIYMLLLYFVLRTGIYYYYRVRNAKIKNMYAALTTAMFMISIGSYPQEVIALLPTSVVWCVLVAVMVKLKDFDDPLHSPLPPDAELQRALNEAQENGTSPLSGNTITPQKELERVSINQRRLSDNDLFKI